MPDKANTTLSAACPTYPYRRRIGLIGGSFNPAHKGHVHIARRARQAAGLDEVSSIILPETLSPFPSRTVESLIMEESSGIGRSDNKNSITFF